MKAGSTLRKLGILTVALLTAVLGALVPATGAAAAGTGLDGTITNALTGAPVSGAGIVIQFEDGSHWAFTNSDATGHFSFPDAAAGQYIVDVTGNGYVEQWLNGKADRYTADKIAVPGTVSVSLMPIQYGKIAGKVTKPGGGGLKDIYVELRRGGNWVGYTSTDTKGRYHFDNVETGANYTMFFRFPSGQVVWYDHADEWNATPFEVKPNATTTIDLVRPPVGNLNIKTLDRQTKAPIVNYCWYYQEGPLQFQTVCTDQNGVAKLKDIPVGTYGGGGYDQTNVYVNGLFGPTVVTENATATAVVKLDKAASLHVTFVDAATGAAVEGGACVAMMGVTNSELGWPNNCGPAIDVKPLFPGDKFRLFVATTDHVHGAQWVSTSGAGTGDPDQAKVYSPNAGEQINVTVRLDPGGSVSGTVKDASTDAFARSVCPTPATPSASYSSNSQANCVDEWANGQYTVHDLGPYQWKIAFPDYSGQHAWVWSGDKINRAQATPVQVVAGQTVNLDVKLPATGAISGTVTGPAGSCIQCTYITVVDAVTGDNAGVSPYVYPDGTFTIKGLNTNDVWLYYSVAGEMVKYPTQFHTTAGSTTTGVTITLP
ncbi:MAG TPA: carboxypeptidase-like regulatory domain-containing protein [Dactylosporangium sp.]|nr:carboxypeptidase-like regulatory domain-containing protein [Dactylosporangium sp.]